MYEHVDASLSKVLLAANNQQVRWHVQGKLPVQVRLHLAHVLQDLLQDLHMVLVFLQVGFLEMCKEPNTPYPEKKNIGKQRYH